MPEFIMRIQLPKGFRYMPKESVQNLLSMAVTCLNSDIKTTFLYDSMPIIPPDCDHCNIGTLENDLGHKIALGSKKIEKTLDKT